MRDARVGEQALKVRLRKRGEVAVDERQRRDRDEQSLHLRQHEEWLQHAEQNDESRRFRADREICGHRCRRTLINIRHPNLEWHGGDLEAERDEHERHAEERRALLDVAAAQGRGDAAEIRLAGDAENPGDAVDQEAGRERAQDQIFHAGFEREWIPPGERHEHVERHRHHFERDEDHDEVDGRRHPHQAGAGEEREREEFAEAGSDASRRGSICRTIGA